MIQVIGYRLVFDVSNNTGEVDIKVATGQPIKLNVNSIEEQIALSALLALMPKVYVDGTVLIAEAP